MYRKKGVAGHGRAEEVIRQFLSSWADSRRNPVELLDAGDRFVALLRLTGRNPAGVELSEQLGTITDMLEGRVVRQATYWGWERALGFAEFDCEPPG